MTFHNETKDSDAKPTSSGAGMWATTSQSTQETKPDHIEMQYESLSKQKDPSEYDLSILLLSAAQLNKLDPAVRTYIELNTKLNKLPNNARKAWMLGRIALTMASLPQVFDTHLPKIIFMIKEILKTCEQNEESAWARGYLAAVNNDEYKLEIESAQKAAATLSKKPDALWAHVMNLQAAARASEEKTYQSILKTMLALTEKSSVTEALLEIPASDWRAWAISIVQLAASTINDKKLCEELAAPLTSAIKETKNANDAMMALINEKVIAAKMEKLSQIGLR